MSGFNCSAFELGHPVEEPDVGEEGPEMRKARDGRDPRISQNLERPSIALHTVGADDTFKGNVRYPRFRYGELTGRSYRYIRRVEGRSMEMPLRRNDGDEAVFKVIMV